MAGLVQFDGDNPNGPNAGAPLGEDPNAPSIDDFQTPPRPRTAIPSHVKLPPANVAASSRGPTVVHAIPGIAPDIAKMLAQADQHPGMQNEQMLAGLSGQGVNVDMDKFRRSGGREISGSAVPHGDRQKYGSLDIRHFVDRIEGDHAVLLGEKGSEEAIPVHALPPGAKEGSWIQNGKVVSPPEDKAGGIRKRLGESDPGGPINLAPAPKSNIDKLQDDNRPIPPADAPSRLPTWTARSQYGTYVIDPNIYGENEKRAEAEKSKKLAPFTALGDLGGYSEAIKAAAQTGNESLVTQLVKAAVDKQEREAQKREYSLTAAEIQARDEANRKSHERVAGMNAGSRGAAGRASAKPGEGTNAVAQYIQQHPDDQEGAIKIASQYPDQIPDPVRAITAMGRLPNKLANQTTYDDQGNPTATAGSNAEKRGINKAAIATDQFVPIAKALRDDIAKNGSMLMPMADRTDAGRERIRLYTKLSSFLKQMESRPQSNMTTQLEFQEMGGHGVGPIENAKRPMITVENLDNMIKEAERSKQLNETKGNRSPSVGSQLQGAAQKKTGQAPIDDLLKQAGF
jgi:hypothetical protein